MSEMATCNPAPPRTANTLRRHVHPVIEIVDATKQFGFCCHWKTVLRNFNMTANSGEIYVLLGPRGCGKSTVLNTILGLVSLNIGFVKVFGFKPGHALSGIPGVRIGYTPQSNGLYEEFTINEILRYYGVLLNLNRRYIIQRITFLGHLLALPSGKHYIKHCTEGNKRQVSFALALLHEPELLILDEPCAGLDPLLRLNLWEHMKQLAKGEKTILVTTQSCEDAQMADRIGFMQNGHLLLEGNLEELLTMHNEKRLENLYRRVYSLNFQRLGPTSSIHQNPLITLEPIGPSGSEGFVVNERAAAESIGPGSSARRNLEYERFTGNFRCLSFKRIGILVLRDFGRSIRNYGLLILFVLMPAAFLAAFCLTIGTKPSSLQLAVINHDASEIECNRDRDVFLSCQFLELIDKKIVRQLRFGGLESAWEAAKNVEVAGILVIDEHFSRYVNRIFSQAILRKEEPVLESPPVTLSLDMTSRIVSSTLESAVKTALETYMQKASVGTKVEGVGFGCPMKLGPPIYGGEYVIDTYYMAPGLIIVFSYHLIAFMVAVTVVTDRVNKICQRDHLAGVHLLDTLLSQLTIYGLISIIQAFFLFVVLLLVFDMPNNGSLAAITLIMLVQIWCGISFGVFVAMIFDSSVKAGICVFCFIAATLLMCGIQWPLDGLPPEMIEILRFLPQTQSVKAVRTILLRGTPIVHVQVWLGIVIPLCWFFVFIIGCCAMNKII